jgi:hypothetical protein
MSVTKQLIINAIPLPMDVLGVVKAFCFYDIRTASLIAGYKQNKKNLLAELSNPIDFQRSTEFDGSWASVFWKQDDLSEIGSEEEDDDPYWDQMIAASNCPTCGNYESCYNMAMDDLPECIKCQC